jgi:hypothetical protein
LSWYAGGFCNIQLSLLANWNLNQRPAFDGIFPTSVLKGIPETLLPVAG